MLAPDEDDFTDFVAASSRRLLRTAFLLVGDERAAQDLLQAALERAYRRWARVRRSEPPEAYVRREIVSAATDPMRTGRRPEAARFGEPRDFSESRAEAPADGVTLENSLLACVRTLPAGQRAVLVLRYFDDLTETEIARTLGCSVSAVRSRHSRAMTPAAAIAACRGAGVNNDVEAMLRAAFEHASDPVMPRADLAACVCRAAGRRRRRLAVISSVTAVLLAVAGGYATALGPGAQKVPRAGRTPHYLRSLSGPSLTIGVRDGARVSALAAGGPYLYVATDYAGGAPYALTSYYRQTGVLIRRVSLPAIPYALRIGPGGMVWLTMVPGQGGGTSGTWLMTPGLGSHSAFRLGAPDLLPTGRVTALLASGSALTELRMPYPGAPGGASAHPDPGYAIGGQLAVAGLAAVGTEVAARVSTGSGYHSHIVIAGRPRLSYGGGARDMVSYMAAEDSGLWATTFPSASPGVGPLVRLSPDLRVLTPALTRADRYLADSEDVWSAGPAVWVATGAPAHPLVCFRYAGGRMGKVATVLTPDVPVALAAAADDVYVSFNGTRVGVTPNVLAYAVPTACR